MRASDEWIRVSTAHFEVDTTAGEKRGRETALEFEKVREFFERASPLKPPQGDTPVRIILFRTEQQYAQYAINGVAVAFYAAGPTRDYIVLQDSPQKYSTAIHEYMHLIVRHSGLKIPLWLNEGWADVYSTLRPTHDGAAVGDLLPGRIATLEQSPWMDFNTLTSVTQASRAYNEGDRANIFYAESWALAHMLYLAPDYKDHFPKFLMALHRGENTAAACETAFGKTPDQVYADLRNYLARRKLYGAVFETPLTKAAGEQRVEQLSEFDADLMLADLMAATNRKNVARQEYERLEKLRPNDPDIAQAIGFIDLSVGDKPSARRRLRQAFEEGAGDPRMCVELAQLDHDEGAAPGVIIPVLERALKTRPDYADAQVELGIEQVAARDYKQGIATLASVRTVPPREATPVFSALAYSSLEIGDLDAARGYAATALKWATTDAQRAAIAQMTSLIAARARIAVRKDETIEHASGTVANVICSADGNRLELRVGGRTLMLAMPDPRAIEFSRLGGGPLEMHCGPQKAAPAIVDYAPAPAGSIVAGVVRRIELGAAR